jgi:nucleoside-diphosphate-sugar epimerase
MLESQMGIAASASFSAKKKGYMKRILFIGGTSFFGKLTVKKLIDAKEFSITLLTRGNKIPSEFQNIVEYIKCDRTDKDALAENLKNKTFDIVVDNIAHTATDVKTILTILKKRINHYLFCSTGAVYSSGSLQEWKESQAILRRIQGDRSYANDKREAEYELLSTNNIKYTIYRPTVIEGPGDPTERTHYFIKKIYYQEPFYIPAGVLFKHVYSEDVAEIIKELILLEPTNSTYNICGDDKISIDAYCNMIAELIGRPSCHEVVGFEQFYNFPNKNFPSSYDRSLLLSNELIKTKININTTSLNRWLPIIIHNYIHHLNN